MNLAHVLYSPLPPSWLLWGRQCSWIITIANRRPPPLPIFILNFLTPGQTLSHYQFVEVSNARFVQRCKIRGTIHVTNVFCRNTSGGKERLCPAPKLRDPLSRKETSSAKLTEMMSTKSFANGHQPDEPSCWTNQRILTYFARGSITALLLPMVM